MKMLVVLMDTTFAPALVLDQSVTSIEAIQGSGALATAATYTIGSVVTGVYAGLNPTGSHV